MIKVLVADDSSFFRKTLAHFLQSDSDIEVIAQAEDGEQAVAMAAEHNPDVIIMDVEMPNMDGITAVKNIMKSNPTPILMFSNHTEKGAQTTFEALHAGAADFLPKSTQSSQEDRHEIMQRLVSRIKELVNSKPALSKSATEQLKQTIQSKSITRTTDSVIKISNYRIIAIGASTGGPVALEKVLTKLPGSFSTPIVLIQHMPDTFTRAFAERLDKLCAIRVKEIEDNEPVESGTAYLAPGGVQTYLESRNNKIVFKLKESTPDFIYRPCIDETFRSIAGVYKRGSVLAIIMTGMGSDGCEGARVLKEQGATVWAQNKSTSVVYGMPMVVAKNNLADKVLAVDDIGINLAKTA